MTLPKTQRSKPVRSTDIGRTHTKSKNGCLVCKQRRVKCDETRPRCRKCAYGNRPCSYLREPEVPDTPTASTSSELSSATDLTPAGEFCATTTFDLVHMKLLHHAHAHIHEFMGIEGDTRSLIDVVIDKASEEPYALAQLLALSALHLATKDPALGFTYARHATELQTRALSAFNQARVGVSDTNYLTAFLFASMLGIHALHDALATVDDDLGVFIGTFVDYMRLHRGVRAVTNSYWKQIIGSKLEPLLYVSDLAGAVEQLPSGKETSNLLDFLTSRCEASSSSIDACLDALRWVQWMLDMIKAKPGRRDIAIQAIVAWPLLVSEEYVDGMYQHRPEAFAVFAYYTTVLHTYQDFWVFSNGGSDLFSKILRHLGPFWSEALQWPR